MVFLSSLDKPETIPAFAESPSHKISVHSADFVVPAKLASINFGIPRIFLLLVPSCFF